MRTTWRCLTALTISALALALLLPALAGSSSAEPGPASRAAATQQVYVRPITVDGKPVRGWDVKKESGSVTCDGASPSAVNPGIADCYPTAFSLRACVKSRRHTVLCVRDIASRTLVRVRYQGRFPTNVAAPATPTPLQMRLGNGVTCLRRVGGAWGAPDQHPNWLGFASCEQYGAVYGRPSSEDGINRTHRHWTVHVWRERQDRIVRRGVTSATYVGTAPASAA